MNRMATRTHRRALRTPPEPNPYALHTTPAQPIRTAPCHICGRNVRVSDLDRLIDETRAAWLGPQGDEPLYGSWVI